jgi:hypothetical protein
MDDVVNCPEEWIRMKSLRRLGVATLLALLTTNFFTVPALAVDEIVTCGDGGSFIIRDNVVIFKGTPDCVGSAFIPNTVTSIGDSAFRGATLLTTVTFETGSTLSAISNNAFNGASSLESITVPNTVTSIGNSAFQNATLLTTVTFLPGSILSTIGENSFRGTSSLGSITIPNRVTSIGRFSFIGSSLKTVTFESGSILNSIQPYVFYDAASLESITIPNSFTSIGTMAFYGTSSLVSITIPNSVTSIGTYAFVDSSLQTVTFEAGSTLESIGESAFDGASSLESITIPDSVTSIGTQAFYGTISLVSITIPNRVTSIGTQAFDGASSLESITIPDSVTSIGTYAFYGASSLKTVSFEGNAPTAVGTGAFFDVAVGAVAMVRPSAADSFGPGPIWNLLELFLLHSVVFDANGGSGTMAPQIAAPSTALMTSTYTRDGFDFDGWNTAFDGLGTDYTAGAIYGFISDETLYAKWTPIATSLTPAPYSGALPSDYSDRTPKIGDEVTISGQRLDQVTSSTIDGVEVEISNKSSDGFTIVIPEGLEPGIKDLVLFGTFGKLTVQGAFTVEANPIQSSAVSSKTNAGVISRYVAVYAKGYKGKTLTWKIAGKWFETTITSDYQVFQRRTIAVGLDVFVHLYIDGEKQLTKKINTR